MEQQVCREWVNNCLVLLSSKMISVEDFFDENFAGGSFLEFENTIKGFLVNAHPLFHAIPEFGRNPSSVAKKHGNIFGGRNWIG